MPDRFKNIVVSVVLPVFNGEKYISEAVESILEQSFKRFELLVIDDGSSDNTVSEVEKFKDPRLKLIKNTTNKGVVYSLNRAFELAAGDFIARMDADDIASSDRLKVQVNFLISNPEIDVCGAWLQVFSDDKYLDGEIWKSHEDHNDIHAAMFFENAMHHPTVVIRKKSFKYLGLKYREKYKYCEDYDLWLLMLSLGAKFANIPKVLLKYRLHRKNVGAIFSIEQEKNMRELRGLEFDKFSASNESNLPYLFDLLCSPRAIDKVEIPKIFNYAQTLAGLNEIRGKYDVNSFERELWRRVFKVVYFSSYLGTWTFFFYLKKFPHRFKVSNILRFKLLIRCLRKCT